MITNYETLKTALVSRIERSDMASAIEEAIDAATMWMSREFRLFDQEARTEALNCDEEFTQLPADYNGMKTLTVDGKFAEYYTLEYFQRVVDRNLTLPKTIYTIVDNRLRLHPAPTAAGPVDLVMVYTTRLTELVNATDTNWLLDNHPDIYEAAAMSFLQRHLKDWDSASQWERLTRDLMVQAVTASRRRRFPGGSLVIRNA